MIDVILISGSVKYIECSGCGSIYRYCVFVTGHMVNLKDDMV